MHFYSQFWLDQAAGAPIPPAFADVIEDVYIPEEHLPMGIWLGLPEAERLRIVEGYTRRQLSPGCRHRVAA